MKDLRAANRREIQLDAISALLIVAMTVVVGLLLYILSQSEIRLPEWFPLSDYIPRILLGGFVLSIVLYLWDQRRRLRGEVTRAWDETQEARLELDRTCQWLEFSHNAASRLGSDGIQASMRMVLGEAAELFSADAAAVLGEEDEHSFIAEGTPRAEAERALTHVALVAAGRPTPLNIQSLGTEDGQAIAVPLRVQGDLRYVLCIWRRQVEFSAEELEALGLMGRMVELAIEREESLLQAQQQLEGTLRVLQYLVSDKRPDYSRHAVGVAELAASVGQQMGLRPVTRQELRLAGLIHDVGIMGLPQELGDASKPLTPEERLIMHEHPRIGSEIAAAANFSDVVQKAVAGHHERMDGSGYPIGVRGGQTSLEARILAVCEVFDSMTHRTYHGDNHTTEEAIAELKSNAGRLYDAGVVSSLMEVLGAEDLKDRVKEIDAVSADQALTLAAAYPHFS
jgi:putative nucleotidyltransferase with HDIG domain